MKRRPSSRVLISLLCLDIARHRSLHSLEPQLALGAERRVRGCAFVLAGRFVNIRDGIVDPACGAQIFDRDARDGFLRGILIRLSSPAYRESTRGQSVWSS